MLGGSAGGGMSSQLIRKWIGFVSGRRCGLHLGRRQRGRIGGRGDGSRFGGVGLFGGAGVIRPSRCRDEARHDEGAGDGPQQAVVG